MTVDLWHATFEDAEHMPFGACISIANHTPRELDAVLDDYGASFSTVCEGSQYAAMQKAIRAVKAAACAGELFRQDRPRVAIKQRDFMTTTPDELGLFDAVAMNPPFKMRSDIRHIEHARKFLKPGGRLAALCLSGPRQFATLRAIAATWEDLPASTFAKEGTRVFTSLLTIQN